MKMKWIFVLLALALAVVAVAPVHAQTVTVSALNLTDGGQPANGTITFQPVLAGGQKASYRKPMGGIATITPVHATVTAGAFNLTMPDAYRTNPANICFQVTLSTANGYSVLGAGYNCVQPHGSPFGSDDWCQSSGCNFDNYVPNLMTAAPFTLGPQGVPGIGADPNCHADGSGQLICSTVVTKGFVGTLSLNGLPLVSANNTPTDNGYLGWSLSDNAGDATVTATSVPAIEGASLNGTLASSITSALSATVSSPLGTQRALHFTASNQYVTIPIPLMMQSSVQNLWTKNSGNPVVNTGGMSSYGQVVRNPAGGWYFFATDGEGCPSNVGRWESWDGIHWSNKVIVLATAGSSAWDCSLQTATVFQRVSDGMWIMFYRGQNSTLSSAYHIGEATSTDGTNFTRIANGSNPGLFDPFPNTYSIYDTFGIIYVPSTATYYAMVSGAGHGMQYIYSTQDQTLQSGWTVTPNSPIFQDTASYCGEIWYDNGYYYMLEAYDARPFETPGILYGHGLKLWRSTSPTFPASQRAFLGYAAVNDQPYDSVYMDSPTVFTMDVTHSQRSVDDGSIVRALYASNGSGNLYNSLISTTSTSLASLQKVSDLRNSVGNEGAFSFWIQFDQLTAGDPIFEVAHTITDTNPARFMALKQSGANIVLAYWLNGTYSYTTTPLSTNTPYHIVVTTDCVNTYIYINSVLAGTFTARTLLGSYRMDNLYIGSGYPGTGAFAHGYIWDFRVYPELLSASHVSNIYAGGN
jgi:hypothetical protein